MALISTSDIRLWMGMKESDLTPNEKLSTIIKSVEDFVDSYTNRALEANTYYGHWQYSILDGNGGESINLPLYPVSYVSNVYIDSDREFGSGTLVASADYFWYPDRGELISEAGNFIKGRRNVKVDYIAGYAPIVNNTYNSAISTYPIPYDLKQVMLEMCVQSVKEGMTAIHSIKGDSVSEPKFIQLLTKNSFWTNTLMKYKKFDGYFKGD